jgi:hypothetical protein
VRSYLLPFFGISYLTTPLLLGAVIDMTFFVYLVTIPPVKELFIPLIALLQGLLKILFFNTCPLANIFRLFTRTRTDR